MGPSPCPNWFLYYTIISDSDKVSEGRLEADNCLVIGVPTTISDGNYTLRLDDHMGRSLLKDESTSSVLDGILYDQEYGSNGHCFYGGGPEASDIIVTHCRDV